MTVTTLHPDIVSSARMLSVPRRNPADSFVLHAQLEFMARVGLLAYVDSSVHDNAIARIHQLAADYEATGPGVDDPDTVDFDSPADAAHALAASIASSDLDRVDAVMAWFALSASLDDVRRLMGEAIVDSLAAAGHAPIGLHLLATIADGALPLGLLRGPIRELARNPNWRLRWFRSASLSGHGDLSAALGAVPHLGRPGSDFIVPLMSQAEQSGVAERLLTPVLGLPPVDAARTLSRAAAWSMLFDDESQAPYGWSHCLTMPQAVMSLAGNGVDPRTALAIAGTFVVGFRAAHGHAVLGSFHDDAAVERTADSTELAAYAALHHDAHLVKYTLACFHAAETDPAWRNTYLAAAEHLANWWRANG